MEKERADRQDGWTELEERRFGKWDKNELDKVVICREDRPTISMARRSEEIRRDVLEEKVHVEKVRESGEEAGGKQQRSKNTGKSGGEESRRQTGWQRRAHVARWNQIRQPSALITAKGTIAN